MIKGEEVAKLASLARLELSPEELIKVGHDLSAILDYVSELREVGNASVTTSPNLELTAPGNSKLGLVVTPAVAPPPTNVWREDTPTVSEATREELLAAAPATQDDYFKVKKILG